MSNSLTISSAPAASMIPVEQGSVLGLGASRPEESEHRHAEQAVGRKSRTSGSSERGRGEVTDFAW